MLKCLRWFPSTHDWSLPMRNREVCVRCGATRKAPLELSVLPRFDIPRYSPKARESSGIDKHMADIAELERLGKL